MKISVAPMKKLSGEAFIPGDKSISHRGIILGAISSGDTNLKNFLMGKDCLSTIEAFRQMGISIDISPSSVVVHGKGLHGLREPASTIDAGNSGTTARLLLGLLAGQAFESRMTGDSSLQKRPMDRVVSPLRQMGASISGKENGKFLPLTIRGGKLSGIEYCLPVASAQVKSAIILANLYAQSPSRIHEPAPSRDHTEVMLRAFGARIEAEGSDILAYPASGLFAQELWIPGDLSSAAYLITAALLLPRSELTLKAVGINPTRTGILDVYRDMGADIRIENITVSGGEKIGDITVKSSSLRSTVIGGPLIPRLIDEIPVIALAATQADGTTVIKDAQELKVKESNRIETVVATLRSFGANIEATEDGMVIQGPTPLKGAFIDSHMDHRIALTAAVGGLIARDETTIDGGEWIDISFPGFLELIKRLGS